MLDWVVHIPYSVWISLAFLQLADSYLEVIEECMSFKQSHQLLHRLLYSGVWKIMKTLRGAFKEKKHFPQIKREVIQIEDISQPEKSD